MNFVEWMLSSTKQNSHFMQIRTLNNTTLQQVVDCLYEAFQAYFVPVTNDVVYWQKRLEVANYQPDISVGVFDGDKLVAFILHCIGDKNGIATAYNTGTGVLPAYRGNAWVDKMYDYILPQIKAQGIQQCTLEVIAENDRAIKVYERIGFTKTYYMKSYAGESSSQDSTIVIDKIDIQELLKLSKQAHYSWDFRNAAVLRNDSYELYSVKSAEGPIGYFVIDRAKGTLAQIESHNYLELLPAISQVAANSRMINIDESRQDLISAMESQGWKNIINQWEMKMELN